MGKFVIRAVPTGVKFDLRARNGETIATSEVYKAKPACRAGIRSVMKHAPAAGLLDLANGPGEPVKNPRFEIYRDQAEAFRFRLRAPNGQQIASSEAYCTKEGCLGGVESVRRNAPGVPVVDMA